ncbi:MAG: N-acetylmuramoyl-L-alanine amidase [Alloprevotella sp.]|nr:N-acetylmuramoyl-L-alanine amidase [Alloprevotella sp.]
MSLVRIDPDKDIARQSSRGIRYVVVHCTDGNPKAAPTDVMAVFRQKGWKRPGYHFLVTHRGELWSLLPTSLAANGVRGHNYESIHVCYTGGIGRTDTDTRTPEQKEMLGRVLRRLHFLYPEARVLGHRDFPGVFKTCPCFDVETEYPETQAQAENPT